MKNTVTVMILSLLFAASLLAKQGQQKGENKESVLSQSSITGTWIGEVEGQPAVTILLIEEGEKLSGKAIFDQISSGGTQVSGQKAEVSLTNLEFSNGTLSFKLKRPNDNEEKLLMKFSSQVEATLQPADAQNVPDELIIKMKKRKEN